MNFITPLEFVPYLSECQLLYNNYWILKVKKIYRKTKLITLVANILLFSLSSVRIFPQTSENPTHWPYGGIKDEVRFKKGMVRTPLNFSKAIFDSSVFEKHANFGFARFDSIAVFMNANFKRLANFNNSKFKSHAWFWGAIFDQLANFGSAHFYDNADFGSVHFKNYAYFRVACFDTFANFNSTNFDSLVIFEGAIFKKLADFSNTNFNYITNFTAAVFDSVAEFGDAKFYNQTNFVRARFNKKSNFTTSKFHSIINLNKVKLNGVARFENSDFDSISIFTKLTFNDKASFSFSRFKDITDFSGSKFNAEANFNKTEFTSSVNFSDVEFNGPTYFIGTKLKNAYFVKSKFKNKFYIGSESIPKFDLTRAIFSENSKLILCDIVDLSIQIEKLIYLSFYDSLNYSIKKLIFDYLKNKSFKADKDLQLEISYIFAKSTMFQNKNRELYSEMTWFNINRWIQYFYELTMGLGYRPFRLIWFALTLVSSYALFYIFVMSDRVKEYINSENKKLKKGKINIFKNRFLNFSDNFITCFYFSSTIFFTLRLNRDILIFFNSKEKIIIMTEWITGFVLYIIFITFSKSGAIIQQLKSLFVG